MLSVLAVVAVASCGSSKPAYCSDVTNLENSVKGLTSLVTSGDVGGLRTQVTKIQSDATTVVNAAKSDFPNQTSAVKSSVDTLQSAVKALPANPSTSQIAVIATDAARVVSSVQTFGNDTKSKCG